ncbi:hypothetical protein GCM10023320_40890 [Pseudonocardia adelaidensis]|uniref:Uncharacterized protein n=1 Tax=Pseudonocardia adelaidensis TaxID=648754 RepID=A0ABP9NLS8_9PSEU
MQALMLWRSGNGCCHCSRHGPESVCSTSAPGPDYLTASIGEAVGRTGVWHGLDPSPAVNAIAADRAGEMPWVHIDDGDAVALPYPGPTGGLTQRRAPHSLGGIGQRLQTVDKNGEPTLPSAGIGIDSC